MSVNIIHVSNLTLNGSWFERLVLTLQEKKISQSLVTLNSSANSFSAVTPEKLKIFSISSTLMPLKLFEALVLIRKAKIKGKINFLLAQGHKEAAICLIAAKMLGIEFGLVHHVQPKYFPELMKRKRLKGLLHFSLYKFYIRRSSLIQSLSLDVTESILRLGVNSNRIVHLGHGVNFEEFSEKISESIPLPRRIENFPVILMVGRLSWEKNYKLALESFRKLTSEFTNAKLIIAGIGPMEAELRELASQFDLDDNVEFMGYVSNIPGLMLEADALLHLSLSESYGQVYIEASLVDLPIISFRVGVIQELKDLNNLEITILNSDDPVVIAETISLISKNVLPTRKKRPYNPQQLALHSERNVLQSMAKYLENFGQLSK
jgi:glycosyltransferase involved in cell wall biosynthesis